MKHLDHLKWRYATKKFDASKKLTDHQVSLLTEAFNLAPASFGLQPFKLLVITKPEIRQQIQDAGYGQAQITEASHLLLLTVQTDVSEADVEAFAKNIAQTREVDVSEVSGYAEMIASFVRHRDSDALTEWATRQLYITLGVVLTVAAENEIDACPMEGFDASKVDEILGLGEQGFASRVLVPVGFRAADDKYATLPKVRKPLEEVVEYIA